MFGMVQLVPRPMDSLDRIQALMAVEQIFDVKIPDKDAEQFDNPWDLVDWLDARLVEEKPNKKAISFLSGLTELYEHERPALTDGLDGYWRRELIVAIVRALYCDEDPEWLRERLRRIMQERKH